MNRSPKRIILGILIVATLGLVFAVATHHWFGQGKSGIAAAQSATGERKPIYWYDAMNPQHHYNQPGKAPDGMDLVAQYAEQTASPAAPPNGSSASDMASMPGMSPRNGDRKILYWYDPID